MNNFKYRKANIEDLNQLSVLITNELGTCDMDKDIQKTSTYEEILEQNKLSLKDNISNYYVCEYNGKIIGTGGISNILYEDSYELNLSNFREYLYLVVDKNFQRKGIGSKLLKISTKNKDVPIIYEAWGDGDCVNSKKILERNNFVLLKDLGDDYYSKNNYCPSCVNRYKGCSSCKAEIWILK